LDTIRNVSKECLDFGDVYVSESELSKRGKQVGVPQIIIKFQGSRATLATTLANIVGPAVLPEFLDSLPTTLPQSRLFVFQRTDKAANL